MKPWHWLLIAIVIVLIIGWVRRNKAAKTQKECTCGADVNGAQAPPANSNPAAQSNVFGLNTRPSSPSQPAPTISRSGVDVGAVIAGSGRAA